jgi:hypothetical protein
MKYTALIMINIIFSFTNSKILLAFKSQIYTFGNVKINEFDPNGHMNINKGHENLEIYFKTEGEHGLHLKEHCRAYQHGDKDQIYHLDIIMEEDSCPFEYQQLNVVEVVFHLKIRFCCFQNYDNYNLIVWNSFEQDPIKSKIIS